MSKIPFSWHGGSVASGTVPRKPNFAAWRQARKKKACRKGKPTAFHIIKSLLVLTRLPLLFLNPNYTPHENAAFLTLKVLLFL